MCPVSVSPQLVGGATKRDTMNLKPYPLGDKAAADQRANLNTALAQLQAALTMAKFGGNPISRT
jgi:hypothetical protein